MAYTFDQTGSGGDCGDGYEVTITDNLSIFDVLLNHDSDAQDLTINSSESLNEAYIGLADVEITGTIQVPQTY